MSTTHHRPMPDFADALERHLRQAAAEAALAVPAVAGPAASRRRAVRGPVGGFLRRPLAVAGSLAVVVAIVVAVLLFSSSGTNTPRAFGAPLVLRTPLIVLPEIAKPGGSAELILGPGASKITQGHAVPTPYGTAYVYGDDRGQCINAAGPGAPDPRDARGVTCVTGEQFRSSGIVLWVGTDDAALFIAALPQGVRNPTVSYSGGPEQELRPSDIGVVTVSASEPAVVTTYDVEGHARRTKIAQPIGASPGKAVQPTGTITSTKTTPTGRVITTYRPAPGGPDPDAPAPGAPTPP